MKLFLFLLAFLFPVSAMAAVGVMPHRALYDVSLDHVSADSGLTNVSGTMLFDWGDACDAWTIQQKIKLLFVDRDREDIEVDSASMMWESKDGKRYHFSLRHLINGEEDERYIGRADIDKTGGQAHYSVPQDKEPMKLAEWTVFPATHAKLILEHAEKGDNFFSLPVFDGADEAGYVDVSAFIGEVRNVDIKSFPKNELIQKKIWPVRLAFFKPNDQIGVPDYEMDLELQSNGVAQSIVIDYGDFRIKGRLISLEKQETSWCQ